MGWERKACTASRFLNPVLVIILFTYKVFWGIVGQRHFESEYSQTLNGHFLICLSRNSLNMKNLCLICILDADKCLYNETNPCHMNATCSYYMGLTTCMCNQGYTGNGTHCEGKDWKTFSNLEQMLRNIV